MTTPGGSTIGSIRIEHTLTSGANGILLVGLQPALERRIAIRRLPGDLLEDRALVERFRREARLGARVHHPNVVAVLDSFAYRGDHYLILEYVDGPSLRDVLAQAGPAPPGVAVALALEVARGLRELHGRGIVHANLTLERILVSRWGTPKIRGLGRSREGGEGDVREDVHAFGAILYELLTGEPPGEEAPSRIRGIPRRLARFVSRCLAPDPERRPRGMEAVCRELDSLTEESQPHECRNAVASWLYVVGSVRPTESAPLDEVPRGLEPERGWATWLPRRGAGLAAAVAVAFLAVVSVIRLVASDGTPEEGAPVPAVSSGTPEPPPPEPAHLRFVVHPWAEVEIEGRAPFLTPRAAPIELPPGEYEVVYRHPKLGTVKRQIRVKAGEERVIREVLLPGSAS